MTTASRRAQPPTGRDGFGQLLKAEWTKFRTMPGTVWSLLSAAGSMVLFAVLISSGSPGTFDRAPYVDQFRFVHQPLTDDGTIVARVRSQDDSHPWAMAGIMIKTSAVSGAPYAAMLVTPGHGVRMRAGFTTDLPGSPGTSPRWLQLTRAGSTITGYESADGTTWLEVGAVTLAGLPQTVEVGLFVTSPGLSRQVPMRPALAKSRPGRASFDAVHVAAATPQPPTRWSSQDVGRSDDRPTEDHGPDADGLITVTGTGDIIGQSDDGSRVTAAVAGTIAAILPIVALGVLAITDEYRTAMIRTSLTATPRRGRVLAAKAVVLASAAFTAGLVATTAALLLSQPLLRRHGYRPPVYPDPSLSDPTVLRVVVGTATVFALLALLGFGVGAIARRSAAAVTMVATAVIVPTVVMPMLPSATGARLQRLAPTAGLSIQQIRESDDTFLLPWAGHPWTGFAVLGAYSAVALGVAYWLLRRRDA